MPICNYCGRAFSNAQAVRAHLKSCKPYLEQKGLMPAVISHMDATNRGNFQYVTTNPPSKSLHQLDEAIVLQQRRIKLHELEAAEAIMGRQDNERTDAAARERLTALAAEAVRRQQEDDVQRRKMRRDIIQQVKQRAVQNCYAPSQDLKVSVIQAIDRMFETRPVEELPLEELVEEAKSVRDRLYEKGLQATQQAQAAEKQRNARKKQMQQDGLNYANREMQAIDSLSLSQKWHIEDRVKRTLESICGDEAWNEIKDMIEDVFDAEGLPREEDDDDFEDCESDDEAIFDDAANDNDEDDDDDDAWGGSFGK